MSKSSKPNNTRIRQRSPTCAGRLAWNDQQVARLGTASDAIVAVQLGITKNAVARKRQSLTIAPFGLARPLLRSRWTQRQIAWLGKRTDRRIADSMGIASDMRVSVGIVAGYRARHRIAAQWSPRKTIDWSKYVDRLGNEPDRVLAEELGLTRQAVAGKRKQLGILASTRRK